MAHRWKWKASMPSSFRGQSPWSSKTHCTHKAKKVNSPFVEILYLTNSENHAALFFSCVLWYIVCGDAEKIYIEWENALCSVSGRSTTHTLMCILNSASEHSSKIELWKAQTLSWVSSNGVIEERELGRPKWSWCGVLYDVQHFLDFLNQLLQVFNVATNMIPLAAIMTIQILNSAELQETVSWDIMAIHFVPRI